VANAALAKGEALTDGTEQFVDMQPRRSLPRAGMSGRPS
jgi:hypothetical protein